MKISHHRWKSLYDAFLALEDEVAFINAAKYI